MANIHRGEIEAVLDGEIHKLCLTLGALAELEYAFGCDDLFDVVGRFQTGKIKTADIIAIMTAGLNGAGHDFTKEQVCAMQIEGGVKSYISIVSRLLNATFSDENV